MAAGTIGTRAGPTAKPRPCSASAAWAPDAASSPKAEPPESTTASMATGLSFSYTNVTWLFASGRSHGNLPDFRTSAWRRTRRCA